MFTNLKLERQRKIRRMNVITQEEMIDMIKEDPRLLIDCHNLAERRDFVMDVIQNVGGICLEYMLDERIRNDYEIVYAAVQQNGYSLQFASDSLRDDPKVVMAAILQNGFSLWFASERVRNIKNIVKESVSRNGNALQFASAELRHDEEIVELAVKNNGLALAYASSTLRGNRDIVHAAVTQNAFALHSANPEIREDIGIIAAATQRNGGTIPLTVIGSKLRAELKTVVEFLLNGQAGLRSKQSDGLSYGALMAQLQSEWHKLPWLLQQKNITNEQLDSILHYSDLKERNASILLAERYEPIFSVCRGTTWEEKVNILTANKNL